MRIHKQRTTRTSLPLGYIKRLSKVRKGRRVRLQPGRGRRRQARGQGRHHGDHRRGDRAGEGAHRHAQLRRGGAQPLAAGVCVARSRLIYFDFLRYWLLSYYQTLLPTLLIIILL